MTDGDCDALEFVIQTLQIAEYVVESLIIEFVKTKIAQNPDSAQLQNAYTDARNYLRETRAMIQHVQSVHQSSCA